MKRRILAAAWIAGATVPLLLARNTVATRSGTDVGWRVVVATFLI